MCLSGGDLLLRAVSVRIFAKLNSRVRLPSFLFECDTVRASLCQIQAQYVYRERLQTSVSTLQCPMTQNDCTAALPPVFCFVSFCFFKCDRWHLNHFVCLVVILRPYLHMPILHCLWWKYLQCVTDTQNSFFFADWKVTGGPHITASPFLRESLTNADMFCINRLRPFVGGGG